MQTQLEKEKQKIAEKAESVNEMMKTLEGKKSDEKRQKILYYKRKIIVRKMLRKLIYKSKKLKRKAAAIQFLQKAVVAA